LDEVIGLDQNKAEKLNTALDTLNPRSRDIIQRRFLQENKATLHELAAEYKISAERVRQIEDNAMKKLKAMLTTDNLTPLN
jgi:RNA polymerase sigma-32 factor